MADTSPHPLPSRAERPRRLEPDELSEEMLEHVVGGVAPEAALARFEYFRRIATEGDPGRRR